MTPVRGKAVALVLGVLAALALSEGVLRIVASRRSFKADSRFDPWLGWTNRPGAEGINSRGLRDREHGVKHGRRILCLGDSFTWGAGVRSDETYARILEGETGLETINAGVCGWGTAQELLWLQREGFGYAPDVVVLGFFLNDFADNASDNMFGSRRPFYTLDGGRLTLKGVPIQKPRVPIRFLTAELFRAGWSWFDRGYLRAADLSPIPRGARRDLTAKPAPAEAVTLAMLAEMKRLCEARGIRLIVLASPSLCQIRSMSAPCREQDPILYAALTRVCAAAQIPMVDPLPELSASEAAGVPVFPPSETDEWHWNANGHRIVARALAAQIRVIP